MACSGGSTAPVGGTTPGGVTVGAACVPSQELSPTFDGFSEMELGVDPGNPACGGGVCLVNHFRGRVTCPYGEQPDGGVPPGAAPCTVPGTTTPLTPGRSGVPAQCTDRSAASTVYCSCRCANANGKTDDGAAYCACGQGYACTQLVVSSDAIGGAYCMKANTAYDRASACQVECDPTVTKCGVPDAGALPAGPPDGGATEAFIAVIRAQDDLCLPQALATDASGRARCRIVEALAP
jgi:hypothetical protein